MPVSNDPLIILGIEKRKQVAKAQKEAAERREANATKFDSTEYPSFIVGPIESDFVIDEELTTRRKLPKFVELDNKDWLNVV